MNRALKAFLRAIATLCLWGGPILGVLVFVASFALGETARVAAGLVVAAYFVVMGLLIGGVLQLLLSIDDRLERLEANR